MVLGATLGIQYLDSSYDVISYANAALLSPLKQFQSGTSPENVQCDDGLQLAIKKEDNSPACVKPQTATRLVTLGWAVQPVGMVLTSSQSYVTMTQFTSKTFLTDKTKQEISTQVADLYKKLANPYPVVKYDSIDFEVEIVGYDSQNSTFSIRSNATAKLAGLQESEKYLLDATYSNATGSKISNVYLVHETKYVPDGVTSRAMEEAVNDNAVKEFFAKYPAARSYGSVSYLDPSEVQRLKYVETYGGSVVANNEYSFLPNASSVLLVGFPAYRPAPGMTSAEIPGIDVYLDTSTFKVLGTEKKYWTTG